MYLYGLTALYSSGGTGGAFADLCLHKSEFANVKIKGIMKIQQSRPTVCVYKPWSSGASNAHAVTYIPIYLINIRDRRFWISFSKRCIFVPFAALKG